MKELSPDPRLALRSLTLPARWGWALLGAGGLAFAAGLLLAPQRAWANLLILSFYLLSLGLGGVLFIAFHHVTGARWSERVLPAAGTLAALVPVGAAGVALVLLAYPQLYPWYGHTWEEPAAWFRASWLNRPFFLARAAVILGLWLYFAHALTRRGNGRLSAAFLVVFGVTCWVASNDWIMSLEPEWSSTVFGVYQFAGLYLATLAALVLLVTGPRPRVNEEQLHDLGKLLFGFSSFWVYIWFCQYMLIWFVNNPEETTYYLHRTSGRWGPLFLLNVFLGWVVPFLVLMSAAMKRSPAVLRKVAMVVLIGRWLDLYLAVAPAIGEQPALGVPEVGLAVAAAGAVVVAITER
jgi:hypothetical protein